MILLIVIVQEEDVGKLSERLLGDGFRLTRIDASGGFLAAGSTVLLLGVEDERLEAVTASIQAICQTRTRWESTIPWPSMAGLPAVGFTAPMEVLIGGAVVFGIPVQQFLQFASSDPAAGGQNATLPASSKPGAKLVVAIVQSDDADVVVGALMAAGYRLTRVNTAGGFLRRGNATLLIGVEAQRLNDVLRLIQSSCQPRSEPTPVQQGMPMYSATVFVLDASHFLRF
jgi:uncharacterized protein YaaQ